MFMNWPRNLATVTHAFLTEMLMKIAAISILAGLPVIASVNASQAASICEQVARIEDEGGLDEYKIEITRDNPASIDLDNDGTRERVGYFNDSRHLSVEGSQERIAPEYRSVFRGRDWIAEIDDRYYGFVRNSGILTMLWRAVRKPNGDLVGEPVCFFDREWEEKGCGAEYSSKDRYKKMQLSRPEKKPRISLRGKSNDYYKPRFLDEVFDYYYGIAGFVEPTEIDFDNDGEAERVGTVFIHLPSPDGRIIEIPATYPEDANAEIEPTFQNARLIQFFTEVKRKPGANVGNARIAFLESLSGSGRILIDDYHMPDPFRGSPHVPFHQIYELHGSFPRLRCQSEFSWRTIYTTEGVR